MKKITHLKKIEKRIMKIKQDLLSVGEMRPGSLSMQYNVCGKAGCACKDLKNPKKHGPYHQLSYVRKGKSTSQFIRKEFIEETKEQVVNFKLFKKLVDEWINLALQHAKLRIEIAKEKDKS
jgi:hypothetical protein